MEPPTWQVQVHVANFVPLPGDPAPAAPPAQQPQQDALPPPPPPPPAPPVQPPPAIAEDLPDDDMDDYLLGPWAIAMDEDTAAGALAFELPMQEEINIEEPRGNRELDFTIGFRRAPGIAPATSTTVVHSLMLADVPPAGGGPASSSSSKQGPAPAAATRDRDLQIQMELYCDLALAPLAFRHKYQSDGEEPPAAAGAPPTSATAPSTSAAAPSTSA
ncbi:hypothetical protein KUF71_019455, partial [Frankliniella fusca]